MRGTANTQSGNFNDMIIGYEPGVKAEVLTDGNATVARVRAASTYREFGTAASAKKHPLDHPNEEIGVLLAMARALRTISRDMERAAWEEVRAGCMEPQH